MKSSENNFCPLLSFHKIFYHHHHRHSYHRRHHHHCHDHRHRHQVLMQPDFVWKMWGFGVTLLFIFFSSYSDLLVSAPYHGQDEGRVYVYMNNGKVSSLKGRARQNPCLFWKAIAAVMPSFHLNIPDDWTFHCFPTVPDFAEKSENHCTSTTDVIFICERGTGAKQYRRLVTTFSIFYPFIPLTFEYHFVSCLFRHQEH